MKPNDFTTQRYRGKEGYIDPIIDSYSIVPHIDHTHFTLHPGCTRMHEWGTHAMKKMEKEVLTLRRTKNVAEILPAKDVSPPNTSIGNSMPNGRPYKFERDRLIVYLTLFPNRYAHEGASQGGLSDSRFDTPYALLKKNLNRDLMLYNFDRSNPSLQVLARDPSILGAAQLVIEAPEQQTWVGIFQHALRENNLLDPSFRKLTFSIGDNCIENYPPEFPYYLLPKIMRTCPGWFDYRPGKGEKNAPRMACNFTVSGIDSKGIRAIVQTAFVEAGTPSDSQYRFMNMVDDAMTIPRYAGAIS